MLITTTHTRSPSTNDYDRQPRLRHVRLAPAVARTRQCLAKFLLQHRFDEAAHPSADPVLGPVEPIVEKPNPRRRQPPLSCYPLSWRGLRSSAPTPESFGLNDPETTPTQFQPPPRRDLAPGHRRLSPRPNSTLPLATSAATRAGSRSRGLPYPPPPAVTRMKWSSLARTVSTLDWISSTRPSARMMVPLETAPEPPPCDPKAGVKYLSPR